MSIVIPEHVEYDNVKHYPLENPYYICFRIYIYIYYLCVFYICAQMLICFMYLYFNTHTYIILIVTGMGKYQKLMVSGGLLTSILWLLFGTG